MAKGTAPTSQPGGARDVILNALRVPLIHLLAVQPSTEARLAETCRTSLANVRELLPKIAKQDAEKWELTNKSYRDLNPYKFPYKTTEDREKTIDNAIRAFDRLRLTKDDKLWQILLPREERGQGKCLSRLSVKVPEAKPAKPSTPLHKMMKLNDKKPVAKKQEEKKKEVKEGEAKPKKAVKEKVVKPVTSVKEKPVNGNTPMSSTPKSSTPKVTATAPANRYVPTESNKIRKKVVATDMNSSPRVKPNMASRDLNRDPYGRRQKPAMPVNTKPKNPSPLSQSPPVNASDFDSPPAHKPLPTTHASAATPGHSDSSLKRKANELDSDIHNHSLAVKKVQVDRSTPNRTPTSTNGRMNGSTPSSTNSLKRKSDSSSSSSTPTTKIRKVTSIDTSLASRYPHHAQTSPGASSASTTSPSVPSLSFRQTVELSQKFQKYYKKYEDLYWQLTESESAPTEAQRNDLLKMHKKLEEMKREIKSGAGVHR
jgi:RNA polymerase II elongation factor ELL